jgi:hypothetical protein
MIVSVTQTGERSCHDPIDPALPYKITKKKLEHGYHLTVFNPMIIIRTFNTLRPLLFTLATSNGKSVYGTGEADKLTVVVRLANAPSRATQVPEKLPPDHGEYTEF